MIATKIYVSVFIYQKINQNKQVSRVSGIQRQKWPLAFWKFTFVATSDSHCPIEGPPGLEIYYEDKSKKQVLGGATQAVEVKKS